MDFGKSGGSGISFGSGRSQPDEQPIARHLPYRVRNAEELGKWLAQKVDTTAQSPGPNVLKRRQLPQQDQHQPVQQALEVNQASAADIFQSPSRKSAGSGTSTAAYSFHSVAANKPQKSPINIQELLAKVARLKETEEISRKLWERKFHEGIARMIKNDYSISFEKQFRRYFSPQISNDWAIVRPLENVDMDQFFYPTIPIRDILFFYNTNSKEIRWECPREIEKSSGLRWLMADPLALCLNDSLIGFMIRTYPCHVFDMLKLNTTGAQGEQSILEYFQKKDKKKKQCHVYILLDPRAIDLDNPDKIAFFHFLQAIFYIGKGTALRAFEHLRRTARRQRPELMCDFGASFKKSRIREIWDSGSGVLILQTFSNISNEEALLREHLMILARFTHGTPASDVDKTRGLANTACPRIILGPICITNKKDSLYDPPTRLYDSNGDCYDFNIDESGILDDLKMRNQTVRREVGVRLLYRAFLAFLVDRREPQYECNIEPMPVRSEIGLSRDISSQGSGYGYGGRERIPQPRTPQHSSGSSSPARGGGRAGSRGSSGSGSAGSKRRCTDGAASSPFENRNY